MSIDRLQNSILKQNAQVDKKYTGINRARKVTNLASGAVWLGAGYLGAKSISKEKSILKDGLAGASNFVLKHLNNGIKAIDKKEKFKGASDLLQKAKNAPAKNKALVVFGAFIASRLLNVVKRNNYLKGVLKQAKVDEKAIRANEALENEAVAIAERKALLENFNPDDLLE